MKVRFYKGPKHNQVYDIIDGMRVVKVERPNKEYMGYASSSLVQAPHVQVDTGIYEWTTHTHPDGCRYFIWTGWK